MKRLAIPAILWLFAAPGAPADVQFDLRPHFNADVVVNNGSGVLDPTQDPGLNEQVEAYQLMTLNWPAIDNGKVPAGNGAIGLVLAYGDEAVSVPLLQVIKLPLIGTHYELADLDRLEEIINDSMESLIDINADLGWLAGRAPCRSRAAAP